MNKIRIIQACDNFYPNIDGVVQVVYNYHKYFLKHEHSFLVVPKIGKKQPKIKNTHYIHSTKLIRGYVTPYPYSDHKLKKKIKLFKPQIIHIHSPFLLGKFFYKYAKKHHIPIIMTFHSQYYKDFKTIFKSKLIAKIAIRSIVKLVNRMDRVFTVNEATINVMKGYGIKSYIEVLPNATELVPLNKVSAIKIINNKFKLNNDLFKMIFLSRMLKQKNLQMILDVAIELKKHDFKFVILMCGDGLDLKWFKTNVIKNKLHEYFIFTGEVKDRVLISQLFAWVNLNLMFSFYDASPLTIIEASSQATPTICIENSACSKVINNEFNGYKTKNDKVDIAKKIINVSKQSKKHMEISKNALKTLYLHWNDVCKKVDGVYRDIINKNQII